MKSENQCQECGKPLRWFNLLLHEKCWDLVIRRVLH